MLRLHHFGITAHSLEETIQWYSKNLGFTYDYTYEVEALKMKAAFMSLGEFRLEIFEVENAEPMPTYRNEVATNIQVRGLNHIALAVEDIETTVHTLKQQGIEFVTDLAEIPNSQGERYTFFKDNNGVLIELFQPNPSNDKGVT
ncbi:VOC family protein [Leptolyngbya sp. NIES-2104]|uniref:VOC family protein n=1 Tax=Leptolyngbya sp. NIES-2104 TaxID=1552121 RepID=UPI0006ECCD19|nr:VOC family protein [Leptolyngbya sp. NIES-2104]GAP98017.1 methylmalonyl-CoA epimerase [Leptolyngbya sp. NIES-2104]